MNKLVIYFDPNEIADLGSVGPFPQCLIFNNWADASDWFKKNDCIYEEKFPEVGYFTLTKYGKILNGKYMWGEAYL